MDQIAESVDERHRAWCIHCGQWIAGLETSRDHVPSKSLLREPHPENLPVVQICKRCNNGFSLDEEYVVAFLGAVLVGSTGPEKQDNPSVAHALQRNPKLRARINQARSEYVTDGGETRIIWKPENARVDRVILKNARGHAFFEIGEPMLDPPKYVRSVPLESFTPAQRADFENTDFGAGWPEVGSRMMTRLMTGQDLTDGWIVVQDGVYRYAVVQTGGTLVRSVLFDYLATEVCWED